MSRPSAARTRPPFDPAVLAAALIGVLAVSGAGAMLAAFGGLGGVSLAPVEADRAADLLEAPVHAPKDIAAAKAAARRALARSPTRAIGWLELAYADSLEHGGLGPAGTSALQRSYDFEPLGPDVSEWRLTFAFEHWDQVTPDIRKAALSELEAHWKRVERRGSMAAWPEQIANPAGRVAAALTLRRLQREP